jgi:hypothetical protein
MRMNQFGMRDPVDLAHLCMRAEQLVALGPRNIRCARGRLDNSAMRIDGCQ